MLCHHFLLKVDEATFVLTFVLGLLLSLSTIVLDFSNKCFEDSQYHLFKNFVVLVSFGALEPIVTHLCIVETCSTLLHFELVLLVLSNFLKFWRLLLCGLHMCGLFF